MADLLQGSTVVTCEPSAIDVGEEVWRFTLGDGFYRDVVGRGPTSFAWTQRHASLWLLLSRGGPRSLTVVARAFPENLRVEAFLNGTGIGARSVPRQWSSLSWELPEDTVRRGANRLEFRASTEKLVPSGRRRMAMAIDRVELRPSSCVSELPLPTRTGASRPVELAPGSLLVAHRLMPPSPRLELVAEASPGTVLEVFAYAGDRQSRLARITVGSSGRVQEELPIQECCQPEAGLVLLTQGPGVTHIGSLELAGVDRPLAWRRTYDLVSKEALLFGAFTLILLAMAYGRFRIPFAGLAPWLDAALVIAIALALRFAFLELYPVAGFAGDSGEYLLRARKLASGRADFLQDTSWHAWQSWIRAPGFFAFLAAVLGPLEGGLAAVIKLHAVFSAVAAGATYLIAFFVFGRGAALAAGLLFAFHLESIATFSRIMTEPLYMLFLLPALAAAASISRRPSGAIAALAGILFGLAALVRPAPLYYVPLIALILFAIHGLRVALRPAVALVACTIAVVLPWCIRNSVIHGTAMGLDNMVVINLLQDNPNDRFVKASNFDLEDPNQYRRYYYRLKRANRNHRLTSQGGAVFVATVQNLITNPWRTTVRFGRNVSLYFSLFRDDYFGAITDESRRRRIVLLTNLMNIQHLFLVALGTTGFLLGLRDRGTWPIALWFLFHLVVLNLFFHPEFKFRFPTIPVLMVFSGAVVARVLGRIRDRPVGLAAP